MQESGFLILDYRRSMTIPAKDNSKKQEPLDEDLYQEIYLGTAYNISLINSEGVYFKSDI